MILSTIRMMIPPQKRNEALKILRSITDQCSDNLGCLSCHIYEDLQENNILIFEQAWRADEDLDLHIRSDEYRNLLLVLEMALQQPVIRFDKIAHSTGIETIERARLHGR